MLEARADLRLFPGRAEPLPIDFTELFPLQLVPVSAIEAIFRAFPLFSFRKRFSSAAALPHCLLVTASRSLSCHFVSP